MIKVSIERKKDYHKISITGHSMYDDYGKDIVCSAVSSIVTTSINGILSIDDNSICYEETEDGIVITNIKSDHITQTLIDNMVRLLEELQASYPKNIQVK